jgi:YidC/Oxa1 family membrane protein insertase
MDRTGKIGVALSVIVLVGWQFYYGKQMEKARLEQEVVAQSAPAVAPAEGAASDLSKGQSAPGAQTGTAPTAPAVVVAQAGTQLSETLRTAEAEWVFTNIGGGLERVNLLQHRTEGDQPVVLNEFGGIPIGALTEGFEATILEPYLMEVAPDRQGVTFRRTDARQFVIEKRFTLPKPRESKGGSSEFTMEVEVRFSHGGSAPVTIPSYAMRLGSAVALHVKDQEIYTGFNRSKGGDSKFTGVSWFSSNGILGMGKTPALYSDSGDIFWAGVTNQYYSTILTPTGESAAEALARRFSVSVEQWTVGGRSNNGANVPMAVDGALRFPVAVLEPGKEIVHRLSLFAGPREHGRLQDLGRGQEAMLDFGWFGIVSRILLASMNGLKGVLGSYAAAIIVLTLLIKTLMWPMQNKATASMKRMQDLQPKMTALREKYGDDPQKLNIEMMGLYKKHGINPLAGCLPMFVQIPIFFGFYNMLGKAVELRNSSFLWVHDLSQADTVAVVAGFPVNVLPILMAGTMFYQMQLTPKTGDPMQQRIFTFMPLMFVMFCYNYASALALYWTVQNVFTIVQLLVTNRRNSRSLQTMVSGGTK